MTNIIVCLALGIYSVVTTPTLTVRKDRLTIRKFGDVRRIPRDSIDHVTKSGGKLIIGSTQGRRLYRGDIDLSKKQLADLFQRWGYPWEV